jgi:hypothetical protein
MVAERGADVGAAGGSDAGRVSLHTVPAGVTPPTGDCLHVKGQMEVPSI